MFTSDVKRGAPVPQDTQEPSLSVLWGRRACTPESPHLLFKRTPRRRRAPTPPTTFEFSSPVSPSAAPNPAARQRELSQPKRSGARVCLLVPTRPQSPRGERSRCPSKSAGVGLDWIESSGGGGGRGMRDPGGDRAGADPAPRRRAVWRPRWAAFSVRIRFDLFCFAVFIRVLEFLR
jgi:hypothetical protein